MKKNERDEYKRRLALYERLGAVKFQKVVLGVEKLKFKIIKKFFPNFIQHYDNYCDRQQRRALKRAKTDEERQEIRNRTKLAKMAIRKEMNEERNRNYHIDNRRPTELLGYLQWNKQVHQRGLIKNAILVPIFIAGTVLSIPFAAPLLVIELLSTAINFECVNIQNYNLCKLERLQPILERRERASTQRHIEEYGAAAEVIHKSIEQSESLPTFDEIIDNIDNLEQLRQMREMFRKAQEERAAQKVKGGM